MDYKNGKIYTIRSHQTDKFYIGSTTQPLSKRLSKHKGDYKCYLKGTCRFITSFEIIKFEDAYIELLEEYSCDNKLQLHRREGELIRDNNCVNKIIAGRTIKEYKEDNKDKIKEYYEQNKEQIKEYKQKWSEENKDKIKQKNTEYYEKNKEAIKQKRRDKYKQTKIY